MELTDTFILADNQDVTRIGVSALAGSMFRNARLLSASCKRDLINVLERYRQAVVVIDYTLFDIKSIDDLRIISSRFPETHWVLFSSELSEDFIRRAALEHTFSIVLKENSEEEIRSALRCSSRGERFLCPRIANFLLTAPERKEATGVLTPAEVEVLRLIAAGLSAKDIATRRFSSAHTIITHKKNIFRKLGVNNVYEATKYALRAGLVEMAEYYI